ISISGVIATNGGSFIIQASGLESSAISIPGTISTSSGTVELLDSDSFSGGSVSFSGRVDTQGGNLTVREDTISLDTAAGPVTLSTRRIAAGADPLIALSTGNSGDIALFGTTIRLGSASGSNGSAN